MANRRISREYIDRDLSDFLDNLSKKLTEEAKWRQPVTKSEASKYLAQLLNKKSKLRVRRKGKNILDMNLIWED